MNDRMSFRPLKISDLPLLYQWMNEPHVDQWWHQAWDMEKIDGKYRPRIEGKEPTHVFAIEHNGQSIGLIQWYRWSDYPEHANQLGAKSSEAGIDLAIGEVGSLGKGLGTAAIRNFTESIIFADPLVVACVADPEEDNIKSVRAFERAGFICGKTVQLAGESLMRCVVRRGR